MNRKNSILALRPALSLSTEHSSIQEKFQNNTLRPILKFQNDFLIKCFQNHCIQRKCNFEILNELQKKAFIEDSLRKDQRFKQLLLGSIIGLFTIEEYSNYLNYDKEYNRRMITMITKRLQDELIIIENYE
ncbi:MAG: glyoxalase [Saprospiraceae bacterium]